MSKSNWNLPPGVSQRDISGPDEDECPNCGGSGEAEQGKTCRDCGGTGLVRVEQPVKRRWRGQNDH